MKQKPFAIKYSVTELTGEYTGKSYIAVYSHMMAYNSTVIDITRNFWIDIILSRPHFSRQKWKHDNEEVALCGTSKKYKIEILSIFGENGTIFKKIEQEAEKCIPC